MLTAYLATVALDPTRAQAQGMVEEVTGVSEEGWLGGFESSPCPIALPKDVGDVRCGFVSVPESYLWGRGRIRLAVMVAKARTPSSQAPVMYLSGGPGYSNIANAVHSLENDPRFAALRATRDLIFLDQRGTGFSEPALDCPELLAVGDDGSTAEGMAALRACHGRLRAEDVDLAAYRTDFSALDVNQVRRALGVPKLSLLGASYGAKLALQRLRGSPKWLESAALLAVVDPLTNTFANAPRAFQRSLEALEGACTADPRCLSQYGRLRENVDAIIADLAKQPREVAFRDLATGEPQTLLLTPQLVAEGLYELLSFSDVLPFMPLALHDAARGSYELLASIGSLLYGDLYGERSFGMALSVICSEELAYSTPAQFRAAARGTDRIVSEYFLPVQLSIFDECSAWPVPPSSPLFHLPVFSHTRTLLVTGHYDSKTPPGHAENVARFLHDDRSIEIQNGAHVSDPWCEAALLAAFFDAPAPPTEVSCAERPLEFFFREEADARALSRATDTGGGVVDEVTGRRLREATRLRPVSVTLARAWRSAHPLGTGRAAGSRGVRRWGQGS